MPDVTVMCLRSANHHAKSMHLPDTGTKRSMAHKAHNHPSGVAEASQADRWLTDQLKAALGLVDVKVLDHIIVAGNSHLSFAERGWL